MLIAYASLYPLSGWRDSGIPLMAFLDAGWPRYFTVFDLFINTLGNLPLAITGRNLVGQKRTEFISDYLPSIPIEISPSLLFSARLKF